MTKDISALLDELKSLHAKATEGEWENCRGFVRSKLPVSGTLVNGATIHLSRTWVAETIRGEGYVPDNGNADFIAAIKNAFPALVAAIEARVNVLADQVGDTVALCAQLDAALAALRDARKICGDYPVSKWEREHAAILSRAGGK